MKTFRQQFLISVSATVTLLCVFSCASIDIEQTQNYTMCFSTIPTVNTKIGENTVPNTIGIFANFSPSAPGSSNSTIWAESDFGKAEKLYISNQCFAKFGADYSGANSSDITQRQPQYWPNSGSLIFAGYAPHASQCTEITNVSVYNHAEKKNQAYMSIDVKLGENSNDTFDLLYVDGKDINNGMTVGKSKTAVPLVFKHAQTKVTFKITKPDNYRIKMDLFNCVSKATFFSGHAPGWLPDFTVPVKYNDIKIADEITDNNVPIQTNINKTFYVIPMQLDGDYLTRGKLDPIKLTVDVLENDATAAGFQTLDIPLLKYDTVWYGQKHYIYNITISPQGIEFGAPTIENRDIETAI